MKYTQGEFRKEFIELCKKYNVSCDIDEMDIGTIILTEGFDDNKIINFEYMQDIEERKFNEVKEKILWFKETIDKNRNQLIEFNDDKEKQSILNEKIERFIRQAKGILYMSGYELSDFGIDEL